MQCSNEQIEKIVDSLKMLQKGMREVASIKFKEYGFTMPQLSLMFILYKTPNLMLNELSDKMGLSKSTVSSLVERLENQNIVIREVPKDNRRIVRLSLSAEFIEKNESMLALRSKFIYKTFNLQDVSEEDADKIIYALEKMANTLHTK